MKRVLIATLMLALAAPLAAQVKPDDGPPDISAREIVIGFLSLSPEQVDSWDILIADRAADAEQLQIALREVQDAIEALFAQGDPDPEAVGELVIERRALGEELHQVNVDYVLGFEAMLDEEQLGKLNVVRRADRVQPVIPAFKLFGLVHR